jgi:hypothetical protein
LRRERLTGLLVCSSASGRPVSPCWDPWPPVYDFQVKPDRSIEPPAEPLPARWNLDTIWGQSASPTPAPDDATRLQALQTVPYYAQLGKTVGFPQLPPVPLTIASVTTIRPAEYDGTFIPSNSVRTVLPPNAADELNVIGADQQTGILPWDVIVPTPSTSVPAPDRLMIDDSNALAIDINGNRILVE